MNRSTRRAIAGALSVSGLLVAAACGGGGTGGEGGQGGEGGGAAPNFEERGPITYVQGKDTSGNLNTMIDGWNQAHPNEKVTFIELTDKADEQRNSMIQNAQAKSPDYTVMSLDNIWVAEFAAQGWVDEIPEGTIETDKFMESGIEASTYFNKLYAVPHTGDGALLYYRKDWLQAAGQQPPKTYDEMKKACEAIKQQVPEAKDAACYAGQHQKYEGLTVNVAEAVNGAGGEIVDASGTVAVNSPEAVEGLKWLQDSFADGTIPQEAITWQEEQGRQAFQDGKLIFHRNWPYIYALANKSDGSSQAAGKFDVAPLPGLKGEGVSSLGGHMMGISTFAKNKGTAVDFIKYMVDAEQQKKNALATSQAPTLTELYSDSEMLAEYPYLPVLQKSIEGAKPRPKVVKYGDVTLAIQDAAYPLQQGQGDPTQAASALQTKLEGLVKQ